MTQEASERRSRWFAGPEGEAGRSAWPVARRYSGAELNRISLPLGGIGTGTVGFGGRGQFRDWELENHPSKGLTSALTFFACRVAPGTDGAPQARICEGALFDEEVEGWQGSPAPLAGLPRFGQCEFQASYPFGRVVLSDPDFPVEVAVTAFNPLVPGDDEASGLPLALFRITLTSRASEPLEADVMFSAETMTGHALRAAGEPSRPDVAAKSGPGLARVLLSDQAMDPEHEEWGTIAAAAVGEDTWTGPAWGMGKWNQGLFAMWEGFLATRQPAPARSGWQPRALVEAAVAGTVGAHRTLAPGGLAEVAFLLGWHFPNRRAWFGGSQGPRGWPGRTSSATTTPRLARRLGRRHPARAAAARAGGGDAAVRVGVLGSDLRAAVKEAALFNLSTLRSQTCFRTADGRFFGWEGCWTTPAAASGSCTHVWNYELATAFLFGSLARQMRDPDSP